MKNLVITGDSLSYNRHGYDAKPQANASDCHIGMNSWSFRIRNRYISSAPNFKYGDELNIKEPTVLGMAKSVDVIDSIFGNRVVTITPQNDMIHIETESNTGTIVIYFQKRRNNYCRFNVSIDGVTVDKRIDTYGNFYDHQGFGLLGVELPCNNEIKTHKIILSNFEFTEKSALVTVAGISSEGRYAYVTGQGSRTAKFLLYHFYDRIAKYSPDTLVLIFGGNDFVFYTEDDYKKYLTELFERMAIQFPECKLFTITIPPSAKPNYPIRGMTFNSDEEMNAELDKYNSVLEELSAKYGAQCLRTKELFYGLSPEIWRYDDVHLSNIGNDILYEEMTKRLGL